MVAEGKRECFSLKQNDVECDSMKHSVCLAAHRVTLKSLVGMARVVSFCICGGAILSSVSEPAIASPATVVLGQCNKLKVMAV